MRLILLAVGAGLVGAAGARAAGPEQGVRVGMAKGLFRDLPPNAVQAMSRPLADMIHRQTGRPGAVEVAADPFALADGLAAGRYQLGVFHGFEFAWVRKAHPGLVPLAVSVPQGGKPRACVVVRKDSPAARLADLSGDAVAVPKGTKGHCLLFLERAGAAGQPTKPGGTAEDALDAVVAGDSAAAVVDAAALTGYAALQPGAVTHLRVLAQSDPFPQTVIAAARGGLDDRTAGQVRQLLTQAHTTTSGKPLLFLWNLKGFADVPADYGAQLDAVAKTYPPPTRDAGPAGVPVGRSGADRP